MAIKTQQNDASVDRFIDAVEDPQKKADSLRLVQIYKDITGEDPKMWGTAIIGFGQYHYKYASGQEGDWMLGGFSPRKAAITLYLSTGFGPNNDLLAKLGKHKLGKGCLYIAKLADVDEAVLRSLMTESYAEMKRLNP